MSIRPVFKELTVTIGDYHFIVPFPFDVSVVLPTPWTRPPLYESIRRSSPISVTQSRVIPFV